MTIINQPFQGKLGDILIEQLNDNYSSFTIFSAFAKTSGVLRLKSAMQSFKNNGGKIRAFIGIDLDGTSYEALLNLFSLCDELYVIHSENVSTTYHSKIYLLEGSINSWCAIGSNNLTGGGLWTNFESCSIETFTTASELSTLENIKDIIDKYCSDDYSCSFKITSIDDINTLLDANYINKEVTQRIHKISNQKKKEEQQKKSLLFGSEKVSIPTLVTIEKAKPTIKHTNEKSALKDYIIEPVITPPSFTNEQFWFEMRKSTGGSSNILDLSMLGKIQKGSVTDTPYEYHDNKYMYGGIKFFDINPNDTTSKNIKINYLGKDYYPSTIKFTPDNGSWRIQLKGKPSDNTDELSKYGNRGDFIHKILVFEKITTDYYLLSLIDDSQLEYIKSISKIWALNGSSSTSRAYGML